MANILGLIVLYILKPVYDVKNLYTCCLTLPIFVFYIILKKHIPLKLYKYQQKHFISLDFPLDLGSLSPDSPDILAKKFNFYRF